jgi:phospholipase C
MEFFQQYHIRFNPRYVKSLEEQRKILPEEIKALEKKISQLSRTNKEFAKFTKDIAKKKEVLAEVDQELRTWSEANFDRLPEKEKNLHKNAFTRNTEDPYFNQLSTLKYKDGNQGQEIKVPKGDIFHRFRTDVDTGKLPTVFWLAPPKNFSDHPSAPWYGAWYVSEVLDILTKNPDVWKKTIFILTYDENDGFFDHIPPYIPPDLSKPDTGKCSAGITTDIEYISKEDELSQGIAKKEARDGVVGLGYRVPMIIASPWSRGGQVCSQVFDHTSTLQFLEKFLGAKYGLQVKETKISQWRRTVCGDLTSVFKQYTPDAGRLNFLEREPFVAGIYNAKFKKDPTGFHRLSKDEIAVARKDSKGAFFMPQQESGVRPACALPYEMYADGKLSADKRNFEISMSVGTTLFKKDTAGVPFKVYAPGNFIDKSSKVTEQCKSRDYAVAAGDSLSDYWAIDGFDSGTCHLKLYGPNGFFREFKGDQNNPQLEIGMRQSADGTPEITIANRNASKTYVVNIVQHGYSAPTLFKELNAESSLAMLLPVEQSFGWYDFSIKVAGYENFETRYAGHAENGRISFTDPVMGRV